ncbi:hypothetical protein ASZ90_001137 [hydrocarbon metagenome]|uniref:Uncharacterized protein n=1 Tax=hydrocarbon metagenome TaxID=938273 RepID=A0A0W8G758_9ZZZZ
MGSPFHGMTNSYHIPRPGSWQAPLPLRSPKKNGPPGKEARQSMPRV